MPQNVSTFDLFDPVILAFQLIIDLIYIDSIKGR